MRNKLIHEYNKYVAYQIYPMSFYDCNNDGVGDIRGIIEKLDYLKSLGVDMIWICPIFDSPMDDNGYDVSNYYDINPKIGTLKDVDELILKAHKLNIKIILDFVLNHTSDEHQWFQKAKKDVNCKEHQYYYFKKGSVDKNGKRIPPNNWGSFFSTSAWEYVPEIDEYYLHIFSKKMPDLNFGNKELIKEIERAANFWADRGIDGFRLDAVAHLAKDTTFEDSKLPVNEHGYVCDFEKFSNRPELFSYLKILSNEVFKPRNLFVIGEVGGCATTDEALKYSSYENGPINMVFNFDTCWENGAYGSIDKTDEMIKTNVKNLKILFKKRYDGCYENCDMPIYWNNHDHPRCLSQYGSVEYRKESAKMLCTTLLYMYGMPFILYGDEIGMSNADYETIEDFKDVNDVNFRLENPQYSNEILLRFARRCSRTNGRLPFCWENKKYGGFSNIEPYIKSTSYFNTVNERDEEKDPNSILNFFKKAIKLRHEDEIIETIVNGKLEFIDIDNEDIFAYKHLGKEFDLVVISNFRNENKLFSCPKNAEVLLHNYDSLDLVDGNINLHPFESVLLKVQHD